MDIKADEKETENWGEIDFYFLISQSILLSRMGEVIIKML